MNSRLEHLKEEILSAEPRLCLERARIYTRVYQENEHLPIVRKRALAFRKTLEESSIYILDGELIVGNTASQPKYAAIFPEYAVEWIFKEIDGIDNRPCGILRCYSRDEGRDQRIVFLVERQDLAG
jgi:formate C-acetyltransferase